MSFFKSKPAIKNKRHNDILYHIVKWINTNPDKCKGVSIKGLSRNMVLSVNFGLYGDATNDSVEQGIHKLLRTGVLLREVQSPRRINLTLNYEHPDLSSVYGIVPVVKHASGVPQYIPIPNRIEKFIKENPLRCYKCTTKQLAQYIVKESSASSPVKQNSVIAIIRNMARKGDVIKAEQEDGFGNFEYTFKLAQEPDKEISPDTDYEVLKCNKTPEEEKEITKESVKSFEELMEEWDNQPHEIIEAPKEDKSLVQEIALPDGRTLNLTININFGK